MTTAIDSDLKGMTATVLNAVEEIFSDYVAWPDDATRDAVILWVAHTHVFYAFESTPRLSITSDGPGSGKSRVLEVIEHLVPNALNAVYMTPGVMWRMIEHTSPTMLLDEVDTIFGKNGSSSSHQQLRAILNAGHRKGSTVPRCVGADDVKQFHVFAPVAMAGIGKLPETIRVRSIPCHMRKRKSGQEVRPFRFKFAQDALKRATDMLEDWAMDAADVLEFSFPESPVSDREADVWEPILAIGDLAGEEWGKRARAACVELTEANGSKPSISPGMRLLTDVRAVMGDAPVMFTHEILTGLYALEGSPWTADKLDARGLGRLLSEYAVRPTTVRQESEVAKGYKAEDLMVPWERFGLVASVTDDE